MKRHFPPAKNPMSATGAAADSPDEQSKQRNEATNCGKKVGRLALLLGRPADELHNTLEERAAMTGTRLREFDQ